MLFFVCACVGESEGTIKHTDPIPDPDAVNQDKTNMLFSVSLCRCICTPVTTQKYMCVCSQYDHI